MYQVDHSLWNQIAATQTLATDWAQTVFPMDAEQIDQLMIQTRKNLLEHGHDRRVVAAYLEVMPLLAEHKAIQTFARQNQRMDLMRALPEVTTPSEGARLMAQDKMLLEAQESALRELLDRETPTGKTAMQSWSIPQLATD